MYTHGRWQDTNRRPLHNLSITAILTLIIPWLSKAKVKAILSLPMAVYHHPVDHSLKQYILLQVTTWQDCRSKSWKKECQHIKMSIFSVENYKRTQSWASLVKAFFINRLNQSTLSTLQVCGKNTCNKRQDTKNEKIQDYNFITLPLSFATPSEQT